MFARDSATLSCVIWPELSAAPKERITQVALNPGASLLCTSCASGRLFLWKCARDEAAPDWPFFLPHLVLLPDAYGDDPTLPGAALGVAFVAVPRELSVPHHVLSEETLLTLHADGVFRNWSLEDGRSVAWHNWPVET